MDYNEALAETLDTEGGLSQFGTFPGYAESSLVTEEVVDMRLFFRQLLIERAELRLEMIIDGEQWECWTVNSDYLNPSVYSGFAFNSFANFRNQTFAAAKDGIHVLEGDTDNGADIHAGIVLAPTTFDMAQRKRFRKGYLGTTGGSPVLKTVTEAGVERTFKVAQSEVTFRRDQQGRKWTFLLQDFDALDFIELIPIILGR